MQSIAASNVFVFNAKTILGKKSKVDREDMKNKTCIKKIRL